MVVVRVEGCQMEDRSVTKMWLVRHLEVIRQLVMEDLRVVKVGRYMSRVWPDKVIGGVIENFQNYLGVGCTL